MHTLLFSKVGSVLALPAIFRPLYFLGYLRHWRQDAEGKAKVKILPLSSSPPVPNLELLPLIPIESDSKFKESLRNN
jgi:hypothetical protein